MRIFPNKLQPIQYINNTPYVIHAVFPIVDVIDVTSLKQYLGVETAFKQNSNGTYLFVNEIPTIEFEELK